MQIKSINVQSQCNSQLAPVEKWYVEYIIVASLIGHIRILAKNHKLIFARAIIFTTIMADQSTRSIFLYLFLVKKAN